MFGLHVKLLSIIDLSCVCVCVCLLCFCYQGNTPQYLSQIFTKMLMYFRIGLLSWLIILVHVDAFTQIAWKHAGNFGHNFVRFFPFFADFFCHFEAFPGRYCCDTTFSFFAFFSFSVSKSSKMEELGPKMVKITLLWRREKRDVQFNINKIIRDVD